MEPSTGGAVKQKGLLPNSVRPYLADVALLAAVAFGVWQVWRIVRAR